MGPETEISSGDSAGHPVHGAPSPPADRWVLPWGPAEGLLGLLAVLLASIGLGVFVAAFGIGEGSPPVRSALLALQSLIILGVPLLLVAAREGRAADLGWRSASLAELLRTPGVALLLFGASWLYSILFVSLFPDAAPALVEETTAQSEALGGPWPLTALVAVVAAPVAEEVLFRGFLYGGMRTRLGPGGAAAFSSLFFSLSHGMPLAAPVLFLLGLALAAAYERRRSLLLPVAIHALFNLVSLLASALL
jgi:membrane protease YdiL (CAAX protease family)